MNETKVKLTVTVTPSVRAVARTFKDRTGVSIPEQIEEGLKLYWASEEARNLLEMASKNLRSSTSDDAVDSPSSLLEAIAEIREELGELKETVAKYGKKTK